VKSKKILILSNHFITIYAFRKEVIQHMVEAGNEVYISTPDDEQNKYFEDKGCKIIETPMERRGMNPIKDLKLVSFYKKIMKQVNPDIIFSYTVKPNIYGTRASNSLHLKQVCNITGTGATFLRESVLSKIVRMLYKISVKRCYKVFFQNTGDRQFFIDHKMVSKNIDLIPGSGVNLEQHAFTEMPSDDTVNFIFIGRVMAVKGVDQYLDCAKAIHEKYPNTCFYIAGWNEEEEYKKIVSEYEKVGAVKYIGFQKDIDSWIRKCHCTILPSLGGEGVPNVLLESAATGRVCIGSRINGTSDVIDDGVTGYLYETGNSQSLIKKVEKFMSLSFKEKKAMGKAGHDKIEKEFNREIVIKKYMDEVEKA
jgi:glycosyltransferase involved in cell wall biosynthesis